MPRFLLSSLTGNVGELSGEEARHLVKVHRYRPGDAIEVVGEGKVFRAAIREVKDSGVVVEIEAELSGGDPQLVVTLYQALVKGDKLEYIIQKAVELGVARIVPVACKRSVVNLDDSKAADRVTRWQRIAQEASKQCGRAVVPQVEQLQPLPLALSQDSAKLRLMAYEGGGVPLKACLSQAPAPDSVSCLIGPEGGFEPSEVITAKKHSFTTVSLGPRILRAETAPLALVSIVMYELGDIGGKACRQ